MRLHPSGAERLIDWRYAVLTAAARVRADVAFAGIDVFLVIVAYGVGLGTRLLDPMVVEPYSLWRNLAIALPVIVGVHIGFNILMGAYGHVWEHASLAEARQVMLASGGATLVLLLLERLARDSWDLVLPYSSILLGGLIASLAMGLVRFRSRLFALKRNSATGFPRVIVVGTGRTAAMFARDATGVEVLGFVSDGASTLSPVRRLAGKPILGSLDAIEPLVEQLEADQVVVVGGGPERVRRVVDRCMDHDVGLRILPIAEDVMNGAPADLDPRDVQLEDLLVRPPVATDLENVGKLLAGKRVLVTGAGGSIGSEIVRQVLGFSPEVVYALDRDETLLHDSALAWDGSVVAVLCDIRDARRVRMLLAEMQPQIVFHAAALKHVPVLERFPEEAVATNIGGTLNVIEAGSLAGMERFVLISTDKAVHPANAMGASKRIAELLMQVGNERSDGCIYSAVRFGNVLGSRGSVVPTFIEQVKRGGPVTVTDPDMTRYFMTVDEAVQLVLQAAALAKGSEVFVLDMGEPVRIVDLARRLIRLSGRAPGREIEVRIVGARAGEKITEELADVSLEPTRHPAISMAPPAPYRAAEVASAVELILGALETADGAEIRHMLDHMANELLPPVDAIDLRPESAASWS